MMGRADENRSPSETSESCPFCEGREGQTPGELAAFRTADSPPNGPGWRVRVVPNAYEAVKNGTMDEWISDEFFQRTGAVGRHELFLECSHHETNLARLPVEQIREIVRMWLERMREAGRDPSLKYAQLFKNHGPAAGASVEHAHSQMIATPRVPATVLQSLAYAQNHYRERGECVYCEWLRRERGVGSRAVIETPAFTAIAAYAARQPFETWIVPKVHRSHFEAISSEEADELGTILSRVLRGMERALEGPAYNLVFHSAPFHEEPLRSYHWHLEVLPRLTQLAGYEWGTGSHVNPILPEDAASILREAVGSLG